MATTNLGLNTLSGSEKLKLFPTPYNENMEVIDSGLNGLENGIAIVSDNNTHVAIASGQYVYVRNHSLLDEGLYVATSDISANVTLTSSNLSAVSNGGLNDFIGKTTKDITAASLSALELSIVEICDSMPNRTICYGYAQLNFSIGEPQINGSPTLVLFTRNTSGVYTANFLQANAIIATDYYYSSTHHWGSSVKNVAMAMGTRTATTASLHNCAGTVSNGIYYHMLGNVMILEGRLTVDGYTRTGSNPGFTITLPNSKKLRRAFSSNVGIVWSSNSNEGARANEMLNASGTSDSTSVTITTTETYANLATATKVSFVVYPISFEVY